MPPIELDVTRHVRAYMASALSGDFELKKIQAGLREATWYSPRDRRAIRALCDRSPSTLTRWAFDGDLRDRCTGLIMVWPPGYATPIHDHDGLWGIEWVLQGALSVDDYELAPDANGRPQPRFVATTVLDEGQSCAFLGTRSHAHCCCNLSARRPAITLHLYGGLLGRYRDYEKTLDGFVARQSVAGIDGRIGTASARI
jgi:predicted metal-dependent enzyme (double-stranded beta helix superfamily)